MITAGVPDTVETLDCPRSIGGRATTKLRSVALAIVLAETRITEAIAKEPMIAERTQAELHEATAELRQLGTSLADDGGGRLEVDGPDGCSS
jgi:hypothetical protein